MSFLHTARAFIRSQAMLGAAWVIDLMIPLKPSSDWVSVVHMDDKSKTLPKLAKTL